MDISQTTISLLEQLPQPGFLAKNNIVEFANRGARLRNIQEGANVYDFITIGQQEYSKFTSGKLILTTTLSDIKYNTVVTDSDQYHMFCLESEYAMPELRAFTVAAKALRSPLSSMQIRIDELLPNKTIQSSPDLHTQLKEVNKGLYQLHRAVRNMSDASIISSFGDTELRNIVALLTGLTKKANTLLAPISRRITFQPLSQKIYCQVNWEILERAILNLISNAAKYAKEDTPIQLSMHLGISKLYISVQSECENSQELLSSSIFSGFIREPAITDENSGIGLGLTIVHNVAAAHNGTLLIEHPNDNSLRFTISVAVTLPSTCTVKSPTIKIDRSGGFDSYLIELADVLPAESFE